MLIVLLAQTEPAGAATDEQAAPRVAWWQLDASGRIQNQGVDDLLTLHQCIPQEKLRALAPASDVSLHRVSIPSRRAAAVRAALPWALEERLSEDIAALHFVAGPRHAGDELDAAVVSHQRLQQWQEWLQRPGWRLEAIVPVASLFASQGPDAGLRLQRCDWPLGQAQVVLTAAGQPPQLLEPALAGFWLQRRLYADAELAVELCGLRADELGLEAAGPISEKPASGLDWGLLLQPLCAPRPALNLLVGPYAVSGAAPPWRKLRPVAGLAAGVLLLLVALSAFEWRVLQQEHERLQQAMMQVFSNALPGTPAIDPVEQFRSALRGNSGPMIATSMGPLLHDVMRVLHAHADARLVSLRGSPQALDLELQLASFAQLEAIRAALLELEGVSETLQGADSGNEGVSARLRVQRSES